MTTNARFNAVTRLHYSPRKEVDVRAWPLWQCFNAVTRLHYSPRYSCSTTTTAASSFQCGDPPSLLPTLIISNATMAIAWYVSMR